MFSKNTSADAKSTYSVSSTATTLKPADASASNKWFSKTLTSTPKDQAPASTSSTSAKAVHNEAIASYLAFR